MPSVTLDEHLGDTGTEPHCSIKLQPSAPHQQVRVNGLVQHEELVNASQHLIRTAEPGIERHVPRVAPCRAAHPPLVQSDSSGPGQPRCMLYGNLTARIQSDKMRPVPVSVPADIRLLPPLENGAVLFANPRSQELFAGCTRSLDAIVIDTKRVRRFEYFRKEFPDALLVERRSHGKPRGLAALYSEHGLRRCARTADQFPRLRIGHEPFQPEFAGLLKHRPDPAEIVLVLCKGIMLPKRLHEPRGTGGHVPVTRMRDGRRVSVRVGNDMANPTSPHAVSPPGAKASVRDRPLHQIGHGQHALGQVGRAGRPIGHLDIQIEMIIPVPHRLEVLDPDPLQVGRLGAGPGRRNQQVTRILKIERQQFRVLFAREFLQPDIRGLRRLAASALAQVNRHPPKQFPVRLDMIRLQLRVRFLRRRFDLFCGDLLVRIPAKCRRLRNVIRGAADKDSNRVRFLHMHGVALCEHPTTLRNNFGPGNVLHANLPCHDQCVITIRNRRLSRPPAELRNKADTTGLVRFQSGHDHLVGMAGKDLAGKYDPLVPVPDTGNGFIQVQVAPVIADG